MMQGTLMYKWHYGTGETITQVILWQVTKMTQVTQWHKWHYDATETTAKWYNDTSNAMTHMIIQHKKHKDTIDTTTQVTIMTRCEICHRWYYDTKWH